MPSRNDSTTVLDDLIACAGCDALYRRPDLMAGERARCRRCHSVLQTQKHHVVERMTAAALSMGMLLLAALIFPFLSMSKAGVHQNVSVIEVLLSLSREGPWIAAVALALVVGIPMLRTLLQLYVLAPLALGYEAPAYAAHIYRTVVTLRPWAMAEVFTIGVLVAMVKLGALADLGVGPAFLALFAVVFVVAFESLVSCESTLWKLMRRS